MIDESSRGKGIGSLLYEDLKHRLEEKGCVDIWALVHEDNEHMLHFLKNRGFKKGRKFYLLDREL